MDKTLNIEHPKAKYTGFLQEKRDEIGTISIPVAVGEQIIEKYQSYSTF